MNDASCRSARALACVCLLAGLLTLPGCKKPNPGFEVLALEGKVEAIDHNGNGTGRITVSYYSDRQDAEVSGTGIVNQQTEIMIDGVASKLEDVLVGDRVHGEVRIENQDGKREQIALKILIDRPKPSTGS